MNVQLNPMDTEVKSLIHGTKLLDTDTELFTAALSQTNVYVWSLDQYGVYFQVDNGVIVKYSPDHVKIISNRESSDSLLYPRESCEFSIQF
jgi:hypothetical protein